MSIFKKAYNLKNDLQNLVSDYQSSHKGILEYKGLPALVTYLLKNYFRLEIEGTEHIPRKGKAIITPNHSGYAGLDAVLLANEIYQSSQRIARILTHHLWFSSSLTALPAQKLGFIEANMNNGLKLLKKNNLIVLFPEGESGNFKASSQKYKLEEFRRGFIRMAISTQAPVIPCIILGAEEAHINLKKLKIAKYLIGGPLPLPLNIIPFPSKWKIKFLEPIQYPFDSKFLNDTELLHDLAEELRERMQSEIHKELAKRDYVYFKNIY